MGGCFEGGVRYFSIIVLSSGPVDLDRSRELQLKADQTEQIHSTYKRVPKQQTEHVMVNLLDKRAACVRSVGFVYKEIFLVDGEIG